MQAKLKGLVRGSFRGITVTERGVSPRIVRAEVDGTGGVTQVTGPQLRTRFGLFDTWASFTYISSNAKKKSSDDDARRASDRDPREHHRALDDRAVRRLDERRRRHDRRPGRDGRAPRRAPARGPAADRDDPAGPRGPHGRRAAAPRRRLAHRRRRPSCTRGGRYAATVRGAGTYRVALGDVTGPSVRIR